MLLALTGIVLIWLGIRGLVRFFTPERPSPDFGNDDPHIVRLLGGRSAEEVSAGGGQIRARRRPGITRQSEAIARLHGKRPTP